MAQQVINTGTTADDGTGESLRSALTKTNDNFTELYGSVSSFTPGSVSEDFAGSGSSVGGFWQRSLVSGDDKKLFYYYGTLPPKIQVPTLSEGFSVTLVGKFDSGEELSVDVTGTYNQVAGPLTLLQGADGQPVAVTLTVSTDGAGGIALQIVGSGSEPEPNVQTGAAYTLVLSDAFVPVTRDNASANTTTVPTNATVPFVLGTVIPVVMRGAGVSSIVGATGVVVNGVSAGSFAISARYQSAALLKVGTNTWNLSGAIE